jgi:hypothetical protein
MLIVGSQAFLIHGLNFNREPSDFDYICTIEEYEDFLRKNRHQIALAEPMKDAKYMHVRFKDGVHYEFEIAWPGTTAEILISRHEGPSVATLPELLMMKLSHRYLRNSPHFLKTMEDIHMLRSIGVKLDRDLSYILKVREKETYTYAHPKLNQSKQDFFTDEVGYMYEHDDIHLAVAIGNRPAYTYFKEEGAEVKMSRRKWNELPDLIRIRAVAEESMVLAIERSLVPHPGVLTPERAYLKALQKVCTSITSGYFREYAWEHYYEAAKFKDSGFYEKFLLAVATHKVRLFGEAA